jgi:hypothetical protein
MAVAQIQSSFAAGEISPELFGEVDLKKLGSAVTTGRNMFVCYRGGMLSRGGFALVGVCKQTLALAAGTSTGPPRNITFQFSNTQGYELEFGDNYLRFAYQGGYVVENPVAITGATQANPCVISVTGTPFANGDWVFASSVGGMTQLNGNTYIVAGAASGSFQLHDLQGNPVDATSFGAYTSGGSAYRLYTIATPYAAVDLPYLKVSQSADVMSLTCSNPITQTEYPPYDLTRLSAIDWTLTQTDFDPVISPPARASAASAAQAPSSGVNATFAYQVTAVDLDGAESIASPIAACHGADIQTEAGTNTVTWALVAGAVYYNVYRAPPSTDTGGSANPVPAGSIFGFVGSAYGTQFPDSNPTSDISQTAPTHQNPFAPGQNLAVNITGGGSGLITVGYTLTTTDGIDFAGFPLVNAGSLGGFLITNPGQDFAPGDSIAFNGAGFASGSIEFGSTDPAPNDTITLDGVVWTFVSAITGPNQTLIQGALSATIQLLVSNLSASPDPLLSVASYAPDQNASNLIVTYKTAGAAGNAYTLAASAAAPSGATLTGGSGSGSMGVAASGTVTFTGNPNNTNTIILDSVTWTFVTSGATGNQTNIGLSLAATLTQLQLDLTASGNASIALANYAVSTTILTVTYKTVGTAGNAYALATGSAASAVSGPTLAGGTNASVTPSGTLAIGPTSGTYPGVNTYFQQRHFYANSFNDPDTFWASQTGLFRNFDTAIPTVATDAITASPWTEQVNGIQWLVPMPGGLLALTGQRAWQIVGEGSYALNVQPITPSTTQAQPQAFNGCSPTIQPIVVDQDVIYVESVGNTTVRDLAYNFFTSIYTGTDLTLLSSHLFLYQDMVYSAWARKPYKVMWACRDDGTMISLTYLKEQEIYGWARHDTQGLVLSVATVTEPPVNALYAIMQRFPPYAPAGIYTLERMDNRTWQTVEDAYAVDSGVSNPMTSPSCTLIASAATGAGVTFTAGVGSFSAGSVGQIIRMGGGVATVTGYIDAKHVTGTWNAPASNGAIGKPFSAAGNWTIATPVTSLNAPHLAGMSVVALADGVPVTGLTVAASGAVSWGFAASDVKVGLSFLPQMQTPYANGPQIVQGARKVIPAVTLRLASSATGFQVGTNQPDGSAQNPPQIGPAWTSMATGNLQAPTGGQLAPPVYTSPGGQTVSGLMTGDIRIVGQGAEWNSKGQVAIQQPLPVALEVTAVLPEMLPGDIPEVSVGRDGGQGGQEARQQGAHRGMLTGSPRI